MLSIPIAFFFFLKVTQILSVHSNEAKQKFVSAQWSDNHMKHISSVSLA